MVKKICISLALLPVLFFQFTSFAQKPRLTDEDTNQLSQIEDTLVSLADSMLQNTIPDERIEYCVRFVAQLRVALETPASYGYPFTKLSEKIHILRPEDNSFRIFNWMIAPTTTLRRYYGVVQMAGPEGAYYPLKDFSSNLEAKGETAILKDGQWYGCEYYRMQSQVIDGRQMYLLFGLNSDGITSNRKLLDVLSFTENGPVFGAPVFMLPAENESGPARTLSRFILEYKKNAQVFLNYDNEKKMILFNRLASDINDPNRKGTYAPTGQTDGLRWENGRFVFVKDAIPILRLKDGQAPIDGVMQGGG